MDSAPESQAGLVNLPHSIMLQTKVDKDFKTLCSDCREISVKDREIYDPHPHPPRPRPFLRITGVVSRVCVWRSCTAAWQASLTTANVCGNTGSLQHCWRHGYESSSCTALLISSQHRYRGDGVRSSALKLSVKQLQWRIQACGRIGLRSNHK